MKTIRYTFLMLAAATFVTACNDELNPNDINKGNPGDEVQFGAALPGGTKTIYGDETATGFPIYWVDGDKVMVASPQCQSGRNIAEYLIKVDGARQNYATSMTRTGEYGVQWGNTEKSDFYSVYPAGSAALTISGNDVKASLSIARAQTAKPKTDNAADLVFEPEDMSNVVMIAKEKDVPTGDVVNLKYIPFSTVIEFAIPGPTSDETGDAMEIIVQSLTLTAPEGIKIAGDFDFNLGTLSSTSTIGITDLSAENVSNTSNSILLHILDRNNAYAKVTKDQTLKVKMCLVPQSYASLEGWTVTVSTNEGDYVKTIKSDQLSSNIEENKLKSGLVHKVTLPALNYKGEWKYTPGDWIQSLPDYENIYLSELSLPGAWYAGTPLVSDTKENYQSTESIEDLWTAGIRAFAVETKTVTPERKESGWLVTTYSCYENPVGIAISGTQGNGSRLDSGNKSKGTNSLNPNGTGSDYVSYIKSDTKKIETLITEIAKQVTEDEYAVLVLSYADGGSSGLRYVDFGAWLYLLNNAYNNLSSDVKGKICNQEITPNTTIKDVLGKLILKINVDKNIAMWGKVGSYSYTYGNNLPALFSYNPFLNTTQMSDSDFATPCYSDLYWSSWSDSETTHRKYSQLAPGMDAAGKFMWVFSSANRTDCTGNANSNGVVTLTQRKYALSAMMDYSKEIYEASTHNVWFYFNCGGTSTTKTSGTGNALAFASEMNSWLLNKINSKTDPSPLGIVMFNQCTGDNNTYHGADIIKAIIEMNSKFYLKHAGTSGGSTGGSASGNGAQNDAVLANGGEAI